MDEYLYYELLAFPDAPREELVYNYKLLRGTMELQIDKILKGADTDFLSFAPFKGINYAFDTLCVEPERLKYDTFLGITEGRAKTEFFSRVLLKILKAISERKEMIGKILESSIDPFYKIADATAVDIAANIGNISITFEKVNKDLYQELVGFINSYIAIRLMVYEHEINPLEAKNLIIFARCLPLRYVADLTRHDAFLHLGEKYSPKEKIAFDCENFYNFLWQFYLIEILLDLDIQKYYWLYLDEDRKITKPSELVEKTESGKPDREETPISSEGKFVAVLTVLIILVICVFSVIGLVSVFN